MPTVWIGNVREKSLVSCRPVSVYLYLGPKSPVETIRI